MITFYANNVNEAYQKLKNGDFIEDIRNYLIRNKDSLDENNILDHFRLDAYEVYIDPEDMLQQKSRLANEFKNVIIQVLKELFDYSESKIIYEKNSFTSKKYFSSHKFSDNLKKLRNDKKLTQEGMANLTNVTLKTIRNYEYGIHEPTGKNLCKIARCFNIDPIDLLGLSINDEDKNTELFSIREDNTFADNLKIIRKELKLTQKEFSEKIGLKLATLISYENNKRLPNYDCLKKIATCLEVNPFVLVGRSDKEVKS